MDQSSLRRVMDAMAQRLEADREQDIEARLAEDIEAGLARDPLLAELHREYLNARAQCARLLRENGASDAMTAIAVDRLESCLGAFETRLIELRRGRGRWRQSVTRRKTCIATVFLQASARYSM